MMQVHPLHPEGEPPVLISKIFTPLDREDRMLVRDHYKSLRKGGWSRQGARRKSIDLVIALAGS